MNVLLTGATGFLGEYLLAELLAQKCSVWALYRTESRKQNTITFLKSQNPESLESLKWVNGDVLKIADKWESWCRENPGLDEVDSLLHSAASLRFKEDKNGEPIRTNVGSARAIRQLMEEVPIKAHVISTAYVCGFVQDEIVREVNHPEGKFVNVYERSKWEAEQILMNHATILRPGVIVGDYLTGRTITFTGWYMIVKALYMLGQALDGVKEIDRFDLRMNLPTNPNSAINILPVDYAAKAIVAIVRNPDQFGKIFHITHPVPTSHEWSVDVLSKKFRISGIQFRGYSRKVPEPKNDFQRMIWGQVRRMFTYLSSNPIFDRTNTDSAISDLEAPPITESYVNRLVDWAVAKNWET